ncbi:enoyl-CoA hydratase/isomerase family protein [Microvirga sp. 3-52]|uniref:enoyl-CoA hydratase/isomerase family protein n=1 Tax=Microvirga sp. 3-52 TaxID=2792425 RepID=UPI001AD2E4BE|nr:enoyl-CoA hydratase/isomerase family protein [Microvirga sp. 3-52]MBO1903760.1 enoyl-CoA hydratase/isomerase family protein [Microvirga sp. 3-52]MBS7451185.1 enoyl-CoA hydratase/isomerase family protein [Microvirga sp. 3-52]
MDESVEVLCGRQGEAGLVTLNRPKALNALNLAMVREMRRALDAWAQDPAVTRIVVQGAGEKAFCAGGDIRQLTEDLRAGKRDEALAFWREEYQLNVAIKRYPKPYVSLVDGICMGGGVGLSLHGTVRVAGDRYLFAMPEVGIGFFPDVGGTYALPRLPGQTGMYLALTGERVRRADAMMLGLATHAVASGNIDGLREALIAGDPVEVALSRVATDPDQAPLEAERDLIDACFSADSVIDILARLDRFAGEGSEFAAKTAAGMRTKSPTSMNLAFEQVRRGAAMDFEDAMKTEFRIVSRISDGHDFHEGVRAVLVDKDNQPRWQPASLEEVDRAVIDHHFASLGERELEIA